MADEKKKKLQNIAKGKHSSRINAISHPKAEFLKFAGFDRKDLFNETKVTERVPHPKFKGKFSEKVHNQKDKGMNYKKWESLINENKSVSPTKKGYHKGYIFLNKVYNFSQPGRPVETKQPLKV
ncbi:MAG: hypothetical protein CMP21_08785 [Rickettsiales bacterium]|nr:hypothetical protein [Rickettsiales bacterium]|tara:strand:- start:15035 stop:15406 length:372 start_codon:yes stop_codon:yes gene_type:complete